eukprot:jgi/Picsp_1/3692/NSC_06529-R1_cyclophilin-like protein
MLPRSAKMTKNGLLIFSLFLSVAVMGKQLDEISAERLVLQTDYGNIHVGFFRQAAPKTASHIIRLAEMGAYNTNHFFRVHEGFVAQIADVVGGRTLGLDENQAEAASLTVPLEVHKALKHDRIGILSMARQEDPNSGGSSFSILLGPAPHLDMQYTVFGRVTKGIDSLKSMEGVETIQRGIFVMPKERINIYSTYLYRVHGHGETPFNNPVLCSETVLVLSSRLNASMWSIQQLREQSLP